MNEFYSQYPRAARKLQPHVEDLCDRMEYEGSRMFDEYPDREVIRRMAGEISAAASGPGEAPDGDAGSSDLAQVLLLEEMRRRRERYRGRRGIRPFCE